MKIKLIDDITIKKLKFYLSQTNFYNEKDFLFEDRYINFVNYSILSNKYIHNIHLR